MGSLSLLSLTTIIQYALFGGIVLILFGWFEKKEKLAYAGNGVFILAGAFSLWVILGKIIEVPDFSGSSIPKELKILSFLKLSAWFGALNLIALILGILKIRYYRILLLIIITAAVGLFFLAFNLLQLPSK